MTCDTTPRGLRIIDATFEYYTLIQVEPTAPSWAGGDGVLDDVDLDEAGLDEAP